MAEGTEFAIDIPVNAGGTLDAAAALAQLAMSLQQAEQAAQAANEAVRAGEQTYRAAEAAASSAAKAVERINVAVEGQKGKLQAALDAGDGAGAERAAAKLQALVTKQAEATSKAQAAAAAVSQEAAALDKLKEAASKAAANEEKLGKAHDAAKKAADGQKKLNAELAGSGKANEVAEALGKLGGPLGKLGSQAFGAADGVKKLFGSLGASAGAYVAVALVVVALTTAIVAGTAAILRFAIANSDAARTSELLAAGIAKSAAGGAELDDSIAQLSKRVPQTREELRNMAAELAKTGLKGQELSDALEDAATKAAEAKFGPDWKKQLNSLDKLSQRFKDNLSDLFKLNIEPLLEGLSSIVSLFDSTSVTGKAIKVVFQDIFQFLIDGLASLAPKIVAAFIQFEIWALKALIAIKPFGSTIVTVGKVVGVALLAVVAVFAVLVGIVLTMAAAAGALVLGLAYLGYTIVNLVADAVEFIAKWTGIGAAFDFIVEKVKGVVAFLVGLHGQFVDLASQLINGFVEGLKAGGAAVLGAITGVVGGAIDGAKKLLGIASPSKVFAEIGLQTAEGMSGGVEGGTSGVSSAMEDMVAPPTAATVGSSVSHGGNTIHITINAPGGDAKAIGAELEGVLTKFFEGAEIEEAPANA